MPRRRPLHRPPPPPPALRPKRPTCSSGADVAGVGPVPAPMWQGWAQSRRRCGRGEPSPGADVAGVSPVPAQMWQACRLVCRCSEWPPHCHIRVWRAQVEQPQGLERLADGRVRDESGNAPRVQMVGTLDSPNCNVHIDINATAIFWEVRRCLPTSSAPRLVSTAACHICTVTHLRR